MSDRSALQSLDPIVRPSAADQVFEELRTRIVWLVLPPGERMSEVEVAKALGVSRQPVRDAFYRLSQLGFLEIRPQRATRVSLISTEAVMQASFVRTALEVEIVRTTCSAMTPQWEARLRDNLTQQEEAVRTDDRQRFHLLDDQFHEIFSLISGHAFAWQIIQESKAHLDRVRLLSLAFNQERTLNEHRELYAAVVARDADLAEQKMRTHLTRLSAEIGRIRTDNPDYFAED